MVRGSDRLVVMGAGLLLVAAATAGAAGPALAQPAASGPALTQPAPAPPAAPAAPPPAASASSPRRGLLYLRLQVGLDLAGFENRKDDAFTRKLSGQGLGLSLAIGVTLRQRWAIFAEVFRHSASSPALTAQGWNDRVLEDHTLSFAGAGVGLAYYWPSDAYLGAMVGIGRITLAYPGDWMDVPPNPQSDPGGAAAIRVGQDWQVTDTWRAGLAAQLLVGSAEAHNVSFEGDYTISVVSLGLVLAH